MIGYIIAGAVLALSIVALVFINPKRKKENKTASAKETKPVDEEPPKIEGLFAEKKRQKKSKAICSSCGSEIETLNGQGRCPYCGAKITNK